MLISIGILAWNEEGVIASTLDSLFEQDVFSDPEILPDASWEVVVVPNGCADQTARAATQALSDLLPKIAEGGRVAASVKELPVAGKSNAWNHYVHEFSSRDAELLILVDADIEFAGSATVANTVKALLDDPTAVVAVDLPLKDAVKKTKRSFLESVSIAASKAEVTGNPVIAGSFYCARAEVMREIWLPPGLAVEDGFLTAMILTDCFRANGNSARIIRAPDAAHYFETLTSLRAIFQHEVRLVVGTALNCYLAWDFLLFATDSNGAGAGALIRCKTTQDTLWYKRLIDNAVRNHGYWVLPRGMLLRRFAKLSSTAGRITLTRIVISLLGFLVDLPVFLVANHKLKSGKAIGYW